MASERGSSYRSLADALKRAAISATSALVLSIVVSTLLVIGLSLGLTGGLERTGVDWTLSLLQKTRDLRSSPLSENNYVFVNVSKPTCAAFAPDNAELSPAGGATANTACAFSAPITRDLATHFLAAPAVRQASIVIIDTTMEPFGKAQQDFVAGVARADGPWVLAPLPLRPLNHDSTAHDYRLAAAAWPGLAQGRVRFAAMQTMSDNDGVIRSYPKTVTVWADDAGKATATMRKVPTAPYLIQLLKAYPDGVVVDCAYFQPALPACARPEVKALVDQVRLKDTEDTRVYYPLPVPARDEGHKPVFQAENYWRVDPAAWVGPGTDFQGIPAADAAVLKDAIVILGTDMNSGRDVHNTSVGYMAGPDIILNAAESFQHFKTGSAAESPLNAWLSKMAGALSVSLLCFVVLAVANTLKTFVSREPSAGVVTSVLIGLINLAGFAVILVGGFCIEMLDVAGEITRSADEGKVADMVTPLIIIVVGIYSDFITNLISFFDRQIEGIAGRLGSGDKAGT